MTPSALDFLAAIITHFACQAGCFDRLTINNASTCLRFPAGLDYSALSQLVMDLFPMTLLSPQLKIMVDRQVWRKIVWKQPSRTSSSYNIQNCVDDYSFCMFWWPAPFFCPSKITLDNRPFTIRKICGIPALHDTLPALFLRFCFLKTAVHRKVRRFFKIIFQTRSKVELVFREYFVKYI